MGLRYQNIMVTVGVLIAGYQTYLMQRGPSPTDPPIVQAAINHPLRGLILVGALFVIAGLLNVAPLLLKLLPGKKRMMRRLPMM